jgi:hypothetical protein
VKKAVEMEKVERFEVYFVGRINRVSDGLNVGSIEGKGEKYTVYTVRLNN